MIMNRLFVACCLMAGQFACVAQITKGGKFIGGTINYQVNGSPDAFETSYLEYVAFAPSLGFMVKERLAVGVRAGIGYSFRESNSTTFGPYNVEVWQFSGGVFITNFVPVAEDRFWFTIGGGIEYGRTAIDPSYSSSTSDNYSVNVSIRPGFFFFPSKHWAVTMSIGNLYWTHIHGINNETTDNQVGLSLGTAGLGVQYFF